MSQNKQKFVFGPANYRLIIGGFALTLIGFLLMIGGGSENPNDFNGDELFSDMRITIAPLLVIAGYAVVIYGIMKRKKTTS